MIIRAAGDPQVSPRQLAKMISREPGFTTELLRLANSPLYSARRQIKSVQQATLLLGMRQIRNMALAYAVRATTANIVTGGLDRLVFWEDSLRRATACQVLAQAVGYSDVTEAFTIGLLQDIGVILLAAKFPDHGAALQKISRLPSDTRMVQEHRLCGMHHVQAAVEHATEWSFPADLIHAITHHHAPDDAGQLARIAHTADRVADIFQTEAAGNTVQLATAALKELRTDLCAEQVCSEVRDEMTRTARDLRIQIHAQPTFEDLVHQANESLVSVNADYETLTRRLEQLLAEKEELTRKLQESNAELFRLATTDPLTGAKNRRAYSDALDAAVANPDAPMSVLMLDIDHFKRVNDTYGHHAGDVVIQTVCKLLEQCTRDVDTVGRLGGEEFSVLLPGQEGFSARMVAEMIRAAVEGQVIQVEGHVIRITISIGGVTVPAGGDGRNGEALLNASDQGLYASKEGGRNRVSWVD
jgi:diguanylate cyclase (GGDEF)-like protein